MSALVEVGGQALALAAVFAIAIVGAWWTDRRRARRRQTGGAR